MLMEQLFFLPSDVKEFPPPHLVRRDLVVAFGGNMNPDTLIDAYRKGYFPWFNEHDPIMWCHPEERFVLFPEQLHISKSMKTLLNQNKFSFTIDKAFAETMNGCKTTIRKGQSGETWIHDRIETAFQRLFKLGIAHSAEVWQDGRLAGGFYGVLLGKVFFGESMFSTVSNASKYALIRFLHHFEKNGGRMIDCQMETPHLRSLGATLISRKDFVLLLEKWIPQNENIW